jgi:hypothetical protein
MEAFWSESVAAQVCNQAELPLLLVPVESPTGEA